MSPLRRNMARALNAYARAFHTTQGRCHFAPIRVRGRTPDGMRYSHVFMFSGLVAHETKLRHWFRKVPRGADLIGQMASFLEEVSAEASGAALHAFLRVAIPFHFDPGHVVEKPS